ELQIPLNTNWKLVNTKNTSGFTRCWANTTSEFGKRAGHEQSVKRLLPLILENQFVPLWNDVGNRTPSIGLTEWNTAVHASSCLLLQLISGETSREFFPIICTFLWVAIFLRLTLILHEPTQFIELLDDLFLSLLEFHINDAVFNIQQRWLFQVAFLSLHLRQSSLGFFVLFTH